VSSCTWRILVERSAIPLTSEPITMPMTRSTAAVAAFSESGAAVLNGYSTAPVYSVCPTNANTSAESQSSHSD